MADFSFITTSSIGAGLTYLGAWNASTNTPTLTSGVGTAGDYYIVSVAGTTNLDGITNWQVGDWAIFSTANTWQKIDNSNVQAYSLIQDEGTSLTQQSILDFQGAGVTASNGSGKTIVTIPIQPAYATIQDEGVSLTQQPILNFVGSGVTATNGVGKTIVTINSGLAGSGTLNRLAMFTPNGTTLGNAPFKVGNITNRAFGTNTGTNSINIGYVNTLSGTDNMLIGYSLVDGGGQEVYAFGNRLTISGTAYGIVSLGFNNTLADTTTGIYILGDSNNFVTDCSFSLIVGESNSFDNVSQLSILGNNSSYTNLYNSRIVGGYNTISDGDTINTLGDLNIISLSNNITNIGTGNNIDTSSSLIVIGDNNVVSGLSSRTIIANSGLGIQIDNTTGFVGIGLAIGATITDTLTVDGSVFFSGTTMTLADKFNFVFGSGLGTKIGTSTTDKFAFWNATPIVQPTTAIIASTFVANTGTPLVTGSTFDGYTIAKVVKALRDLGLLA